MPNNLGDNVATIPSRLGGLKKIRMAINSLPLSFSVRMKIQEFNTSILFTKCII